MAGEAVTRRMMGKCRVAPLLAIAYGVGERTFKLVIERGAVVFMPTFLPAFFAFIPEPPELLLTSGGRNVGRALNNGDAELIFAYNNFAL